MRDVCLARKQRRILDKGERLKSGAALALRFSDSRMTRSTCSTLVMCAVRYAGCVKMAFSVSACHQHGLCAGEIPAYGPLGFSHDCIDAFGQIQFANDVFGIDHRRSRVHQSVSGFGAESTALLFVMPCHRSPSPPSKAGQPFSLALLRFLDENRLQTARRHSRGVRRCLCAWSASIGIAPFG